jgi:AcrR family transcriptional regulator
MSNAMIPQVEAVTQSRGTTFTLIKQLAFHHHDQYGYAFAKLAYLAKKLRVSVRTVQRHLTKLERMGEIIVERVHGRGLNNRYYLKLLGFAPDPAKKHDRWSRWERLKGIVQAKVDALSGAAPEKHDSLASLKSDKDLSETADAPRASQCAGYPRLGEKMRYCDRHRVTHFPPSR